MRNGFEIRPAEPAEAVALTKLAVSSKAVWGYTEEEMENFSGELQIKPDDIAVRPVFAAVGDSVPVGVCSLHEEDGRKLYLEHLFVAPEFANRGIGRALLDRAIVWARAAGHSSLEIWSDPNAAGFYERIGARREGDVDSSIPGRTLPVYVIDLSNRVEQET
jgi:GNAT superfamily N-acetyltransferase